MARDRLRAGLERERALEVLRPVLLVGDLAAVAVDVALRRPPSRGVDARDDAVDAVRREEAVVDAVAQAVRVDRVAEVAVGVLVVRAERRRRHPELHGRLEVLEDLAPVALLARAPAVALVDDDEVEEVGRELAVQAGAHLVVRDRLVRREVHLAALAGVAADDLVARIAERGEDLVLRVVDEDVAIGEVEDARLAELAGPVPAGRPQPPADLERDDRLPRARREGEQDTALALEDRLGRAVDRDVLVVARRATRLVEVRSADLRDRRDRRRGRRSPGATARRVTGTRRARCRVPSCSRARRCPGRSCCTRT